MSSNDVYDEMIQKKGSAYRDSQIKSPDQTHYRDPIDTTPGRVAGNSHISGDASPQAQSRSVDALIEASQKGGLNEHQTAYVLAMARLESGFNPDAAAGTTTAYGLGQFVDRTGAAFGIDNSNRGDVTKQAEVLVEYYKKNEALAKERGQGEEYIYKYHHDGPSGDYGGLDIAKQNVMPYVGKYEQFVHEYAKTHARASVDPDFDKRNHAAVPSHSVHKGVQHSNGAGVLQFGDRSEAVGELQSQLGKLGYRDRHGNPISADRSFGNDTKNAVEAFQRNHGLEPDGIAGRNTLKALHEQEHELLSNQGPYDPAKVSSSSHPSSLEQLQVTTGDPYMDRLLNSDLNDPAAFRRAVNDLSNSAAGQAFRAEGQGMYLEQQNQQLQSQMAQQQTQVQAQTPIQVQVEPSMNR